MPLAGMDNHFAFNEIREASGIKDLADRKLVDVSMIDNVGERHSFEPEMRAFGIDPKRYPASFWPPFLQPNYNPKTFHGSDLTTEGFTTYGSMVWWPVEGLPEGQDPGLYLGSPGWNFSGLVDYVWGLMNSLSNAAIYVHCMLGADRTGAFHAGYLMRTKGQNLSDALLKATFSTSAGAPNGDYHRLVSAYAATL